MSFQLIDFEHYPRREHFTRFREMKLTYSVTVEIDITSIRAAIRWTRARIYPAQLWMLTTAANRVPEFRMTLDDDGRLGVWETVSPLYTVLNDETETFSGIWTPYTHEYATFAAQYEADVEQYNDGSYEPQGTLPPNLLNISSLPWLEFTAFNLNLTTDHLLPILTTGRFVERQGQTWMPLAIQVHHAVTDGLHVGRFVDQVRELASTADLWLVTS